MSKRLIFLLLTFGVVAIGGGLFIFNSIKQTKVIADSGNSPVSIFDNATSTPNPIPAEKPVGPKYKGQALNYLGSPEILAKYPKEFVEKKRAILLELAEAVNKNPIQAERWTDIGLIKKSFDNYVGSRDAWEYLNVIKPSDAMNHYNLGNLYGFYLSDFKRAEDNFQKAIQLTPTLPDFYLGLAMFYRDAYKEKYGLVDDVLLDGLKNIPSDPNIIIDLAYYYKSIGDKENAIQRFSQLLKSPLISGAQQEAFKEEVATLSAN